MTPPKSPWWLPWVVFLLLMFGFATVISAHLDNIWSWDHEGHRLTLLRYPRPAHKAAEVCYAGRCVTTAAMADWVIRAGSPMEK